MNHNKCLVLRCFVFGILFASKDCLGLTPENNNPSFNKDWIEYSNLADRFVIVSSYSGDGDAGKDETTSSLFTTTTSVGDPCDSKICSDNSTYCRFDGVSASCDCKPGYHNNSGSTGRSCEKALTFGGQLYLASSTRRKREASPEEAEVLALLNDAYGESDGFIEANIVDTTPDNNIWDYELLYETASGASESTISNTMEEYLDNSMDCKDTDVCEVMGLSIDKTQSVESAGNADAVLCASYSDFCDPVSTKCEPINGELKCNCKAGFFKDGDERQCEDVDECAEDNPSRCHTNANCVNTGGNYSCSCKSGYTGDGYSSCTDVAKLCSVDGGCNSPFGQCDESADNNVGRCKCMFGFEGDHCKSPWLFVFIVAGGGLLLITLSLIVTLFWLSSKYKAQSKKTTPGRSQYENRSFANDSERGRDLDVESDYDQLKMKNMNRLRASVPEDHPLNWEHWKRQTYAKPYNPQQSHSKSQYYDY